MKSVYFQFIFFSQNNTQEKKNPYYAYTFGKYVYWNRIPSMNLYSDVYRLKLLMTIGNSQTKWSKTAMVYFPKFICEHFAK